MAVIEETLQIGEGLKANKKKLVIGKNRMYALTSEQGDITHNVNEIIKVTERFYTRPLPATLYQAKLVRVQAQLATSR